MKRFHSLKKNSEFQAVYRQGRSYANKYLVMYVLDTDRKGARIGISVSKKVGNSVVRPAHTHSMPPLRSGLWGRWRSPHSTYSRCIRRWKKGRPDRGPWPGWYRRFHDKYDPGNERHLLFLWKQLCRSLK